MTTPSAATARPTSVLRYILERDRPRHVRLLALVTASIALGLAPVHLLRVLIDRAIPARDEREVYSIGGALLVAALLRVVVEYAKAVESEQIRQNVIGRLRTELFAHVLRLAPSFFVSNAVGTLMNKVQTDTGRLGMSVGWIFVEPLVESVTVLVYAAYLISLDVRLFLLGVALLPFAAALAPRINRRISAVSTEFTGAMGAYSARLQESFTTVSEAQLHGTFAFERARTEAAQARLVDRWMAVTRGNAALAVLSDTARGVGPVLVFTYGGLLAIRGHLPVGEVVAFSGLLAGLYSSVDKLLKYPPQLKVAQDRYDEFGRLFAEPAVFSDGALVRSHERNGGAAPGVAVEGLAFDHGQGRPVLDALSLAVGPGEHVALVGRSGCGKSTLLGLMGGRLEPRGGSVLVGGEALGAIDPAHRAALVGYANQHPLLFRASLRFNLVYALLRAPAAAPGGDGELAWLDAGAREGLGDERLVELCESVGLGDDLVDLGLQVSVKPGDAGPFEPVRAKLANGAPWDGHKSLRENLVGAAEKKPEKGAERTPAALREALEREGLLARVRALALDFDVGEGGSKLSGGQKQKVALARVLAKNPRVLLLDEVTASLDEGSARRVQELLHARYAGTTLVAVTHDLDATAGYDRVVVLDQGKLAEEGTRAALLERGGLFVLLSQGGARG